MGRAVPTIGLTMIVKNEAGVIRRCLDSARPLIDYVMIIDTGSTDGTEDVIRGWLRDVGMPGEVLSSPWKDFATNRTEALEALRKVTSIDYAITIDADEIFVLDHGLDIDRFKGGLAKDLYDLKVHSGTTRYLRAQLFRNALPFRYKAVLHEYLESPPGVSREIVTGLRTDRHARDGARNRNPRKYLDDAEILEAALKTETDPFLRSRYTFYAAQSWADAGEPQKAFDRYIERVGMGFWAEEIYVALLRAATLMEKLGRSPEDRLATLLQAYEKVPLRAEALHAAARICRIQGWYRHGYLLAAAGVELEQPVSGLFVDQAVYDWQMLDEFQVLAYWSGHYEESLDAALQILNEMKYPKAQRDRLIKNADFSREKVQSKSAPLQGVGP
jgi:hypothetical protein